MSDEATIRVERRRWHQWACMAGLLGVVLGCAPFFVSTVPPMTDVSQHVLVARILAEYGNPDFAFADRFSIDWAIAPTALFYVLLVQLQKVTAPFWDARIFLVAWVALTWLSVAYLAHVRGQREPWVASLVVLPLAFCWYAYKGFLPYLMTIPLFALTLAVWFGDWRRWTKIVLLWMLLAALFGFHIVGVAAAAATIVATACVRALQSRDARGALVIAAVAVLPVPVLVAVYLFGGSAPSARIQHTGLVSNLVDLIKFTCGTLDNGAAILMFAWVGLLGLACLARWRDILADRPIVVAVLLLTALGVAIPSSLGSLWPAGPRLFPFVLVLLAVVVPWASLPRVAVVSVSLALLLGLSALTVRHLIALDRGMRDFLSGAPVMDQGKTILPILGKHYEGSRFVDPYWSLISAYTVIRGGSHPYVLAAPHTKTGASPLHYRAYDRRYAFLYAPPKSAADYTGVSRAYDYVLLWGSSPAIAAVIEREMSVVHIQGAATLYGRRQ